MDVLGLGTDLVECLRIRSMIERHGESFLDRVYTKHEKCACRSSARSTEAFAGRWAAKEAVLKCLNVVNRAAHRVDVEIRLMDGRPHSTLRGPMQQLAANLGVSQLLVSWAVTRKHATATAIAMGE